MLRKTRYHGAELPATVSSYLLLRRSGISQDDRKLTLATARGNLVPRVEIETSLKNLFSEEDLKKADPRFHAEQQRRRGTSNLARASEAYEDYPEDFTFRAVAARRHVFRRQSFTAIHFTTDRYSAKR